jgi:predicted porin
LISRHIKLACALVVVATSQGSPAFAQSSVTIYGIIDNGFQYQSSQTTLGSTSGGRSAIKMNSGVQYGSRLGFRGVEELGSGTKANFVLEAGFSTINGAQAVNGSIFNRQAYVGLSNDAYGSLTAGRQYTSYFQLLSPFGPAPWLTGYFGAHPGDLDGLDTVYRANNTILYTSPKIYGVTISGSYSLGGVAGSFNRGSTWTAAITYGYGPLGMGLGISRINNSTIGGGAFGADSTSSNAGAQEGLSAVTNGYRTAQAQQRFAAGGSYSLTDTLSVRAIYTNVQYIRGINSAYLDNAIFNTGAVVVVWLPAPAWSLASGYSYTRATKANGISSSAQYQQFNLFEQYALSKRTSIYASQAYQRANGKTLGTNGASSVINATATIGDGFQTTPSSSPSMIAVGIGIVHRF